MNLIIMKLSPAFCHFPSFRSKYSPQHPVLTHSQTVLPLMLETKFCTFQYSSF
jgi:hypothetical protein